MKGILKFILEKVISRETNKQHIEAYNVKASDQAIFLCSLAFLAGDTFCELLSRPAAFNQKIDPNSLLNSDDAMPIVVKKTQRNTAEAVLQIILNDYEKQKGIF